MDPSNTLIFKNIPKQIDNLVQLLHSLQIPAKEIKSFGRKRALIIYETKDETVNALDKISHLEFGGKEANISLFRKEKQIEDDSNAKNKKATRRKVSKGVQTQQDWSVESRDQVNKYVKKLYATDDDLCFDQPPPPYLKYEYPPISKDILDNISIALLNNKKFYTQVLHLMNRMNLDPPFQQRKEKFQTKDEHRDVFTQTDEVFLNSDRKTTSTSESELESSCDEEDKRQTRQNILPKRKLPPNDAQYKKKARQMLQAMQKLTKELSKKNSSNSSAETSQSIFDSSTRKLPNSNIKLYIPKTAPVDVTTKSIDINRNSSAASTSNFALNTFSNLPQDTCTKNISSDISINRIEENELQIDTTDENTNVVSSRIGENEMQELSIFKNYKIGEPSTKLYIKNLQKDVVAEDLCVLYKRVIHNDNVTLEVKVMQHGRMKGQAFVTFYSEHLPIGDLQQLVSKALAMTNGYILRQKPMVVCFGKQS